MAPLVTVTDGVLVRTSEYCTTTTTVVLGPDPTCLLVDPAVTPADLADLDTGLRERNLTVVAGFSTHPHWDHVLWSAAFGDVPRYATADAVGSIRDRRAHMVEQVTRQAPGHDLDLLGALTALPKGETRLPWDGPAVDVIAHSAHAPGHAALVIADAGVVLTGDMCSDIEIPLLDLGAADPLGDYRAALDLFASVDGVRHVVPGHGHIGDAAELRRRIHADRGYLDALVSGGGDDDPRLTEEWLIREHESHVAMLTPIDR